MTFQSPPALRGARHRRFVRSERRLDSSGGRAANSRHGAFGRLLSCVALLLGAETVSHPLPQAAQALPPAGNRVDYEISGVLDGETKRLAGELELEWTNGSGEQVSDLWFHLYLNAFSNNRSTHLTEADGKLRGVAVEEGWGWSNIQAVEVATVGEGGWVDVFPSFRYRRPDDSREEDRTVFSVDLPQPVPAGQSLKVRIRWESQLPRVRRRTGYKDDFLLVAQWFPKLGVYEAGRGWNAHQFHMNTEFYSDYGFYDVSLDLPAEYAEKVLASGYIVSGSEEVDGDRYRVKFAAPAEKDRTRRDQFGKLPVVHDFTWTADPDFVVYKDVFRFSHWAERFPDEVAEARRTFGDEDEEISLRDVDVTVLIQPERADQAERHFEATCAALFFYGLWFGEYPYQHVTVVDPAWGGSAAAGMEYPTLFTCGTRLFTTEDMYVPESVTVHECGHQFWYGLVGNNEFEAAWLDEGFNSYTDSEVLKRVYGDRRGTTDYANIPFDGVPVGGPHDRDDDEPYVWSGRTFTLPMPFVDDFEFQLLPHSGFVDLWRDQPRFTFVPEFDDPRWSDRVGYLADPSTDPIETAAWEYADRQSYRTNSYPRTAIALRSLQGLLGSEVFLRGMRHYAETWRYRHPYPQDFYRTFQEGAGIEADWYFKELFQGTGTVDWSVSVVQKPRPDPIGFFQSESGEFLEQKETTDDDDEVSVPWQIEINLRRAGELRLPVPIRYTFADGSSEQFVWTREEQGLKTWKRLTLESEQKLVSVQIDPERSIYLDEDMSNNQWYDAVDELAPWRWTERVLAQYQRYFHWIGGIGG